MTEWFRVKDKDTGHEYTTAFPLSSHEVLDKEAVDRNGNPLPAKAYLDLASIQVGDKPLNRATVPELREYADQRGIDLTGATKKDEIVTKITEPAAGSEAAEAEPNTKAKEAN